MSDTDLEYYLKVGEVEHFGHGSSHTIATLLGALSRDLYAQADDDVDHYMRAAVELPSDFASSENLRLAFESVRQGLADQIALRGLAATAPVAVSVVVEASVVARHTD